MIKTVLCLTLSLLTVVSLRAQSEPGQSPATPVQPSPPPLAPTPASAAVVPGESALAKNPPPIDPKNIDTSVKPQDDFYKFANGHWLKNNPIPPEYSRWGSFNELIEKNNEALQIRRISIPRSSRRMTSISLPTAIGSRTTRSRRSIRAGAASMS